MSTSRKQRYVTSPTRALARHRFRHVTKGDQLRHHLSAANFCCHHDAHQWSSSAAHGPPSALVPDQQGTDNNISWNQTVPVEVNDDVDRLLLPVPNELSSAYYSELCRFFDDRLQINIDDLVCLVGSNHVTQIIGPMLTDILCLQRAIVQVDPTDNGRHKVGQSTDSGLGQDGHKRLTRVWAGVKSGHSPVNSIPPCTAYIISH